MALFGYPQAQENDAERAVRAALAIQRALADLNVRNTRSGAPELAACIGLECGLSWSTPPAKFGEGPRRRPGAAAGLSGIRAVGQTAGAQGAGPHHQILIRSAAPPPVAIQSAGPPIRCRGDQVRMPVPDGRGRALARAPEGHVVTLKADVETLKGQLADAEARCA